MITAQNKCIISLLVVIFFNTHSMEQNLFGWIGHIGNIILGTETVKTLWQKKPFQFSQLPQEIQNQIIELLSIYTTADSLPTAAYTINSLAQVNKALNEKINDQQFCLKIIKHFAKRFNCSDIDACRALHTLAAQQKLALQQKLYNLCIARKMSPYELESNIIQLCYEGADLEFTYTIKMENVITKTEDILYATPLMIASMENYNAIVPLLAQGADINAVEPITESTPLILAASTRNISATTLLCKYKKFLVIDKQDKLGNTALLWSLLPSPYHGAYMPFAGLTQTILKAGANPELANNEGITPLQAAQMANWQGAIRIVREAIERKYTHP